MKFTRATWTHLLWASVVLGLAIIAAVVVLILTGHQDAAGPVGGVSAFLAAMAGGALFILKYQGVI